ncbi:hypothetical protein Xmir_00203 [Xenorhabdus miraniensis]|uniref:Uncharacterized protein n=1 Tax=Xenorhabdus miraniensis TaxID=351674 RepID=A0A2D0JWP3_9GAMM|nr:hypothetical protein Xmir_00203 [Xenorhabdus miraniensis]
MLKFSMRMKKIYLYQYGNFTVFLNPDSVYSISIILLFMTVNKYREERYLRAMSNPTFDFDKVVLCNSLINKICWTER